MALICLVSAKGAPGTTTTSMLLAALWPRQCILVDADPMGGDVALRLPGETGAALRTDTGLLSLLQAARRGLTPNVVLTHCQQAQGGQLVIPGLEGPEQAAAVGGLWDELGQTFAGLPDHDVVIDAGQAHPGASTLPLLRRASVIVVVARPTLTSIVHTRQRVAALRPELAGVDGPGPLVGFVIHDSARGRQQDTDTAVAEIGRSLDTLRYFGAIAHDREAARMFEGVPQRHPERSLLVRSGSAVVSALTDVVPMHSADSGAAEPAPAEQPPTPPSPPVSRPRNPFLEPDPAEQPQTLPTDEPGDSAPATTRREARNGRLGANRIGAKWRKS